MSQPANTKRIPSLRFPEFSGEWEKDKLENLTSKIGSGSTPTGGEKVYTNFGALFIRSQNVNNNTLDLADKTYIPEEIHEKMKGSKVLQRDVLLNITGASIGRSCVVVDDIGEANVNQHVCIVRPNKTVNSVFLQSYLSSYRGQKLIYEGQTGSGREGLNFQSIASFNLIFPSLPEQTKIATFLSSVDSKIDQLSQKKTLLEQYKKGVMQQIFSQQIRFKADDGSDYPEWEEKNGNELFESISNKNHNSDLPILAITQEHGAIPRDLIDYQISVSEKSVDSYKVVEVGDFIISLRSFQGGIEYSNYRGICSPAYIILKKIVGLYDHFYRYYFKTDTYIGLLNRNIEGIRDGKMISYKQFSEIFLPFPCLEEQTKIANFLSAIDSKIEQVAQQLEAAKQFKKGLLQQMFA